MMDMDPLALALSQMIVAEVEAEAAARERAAKCAPARTRDTRVAPERPTRTPPLANRRAP